MTRTYKHCTVQMKNRCNNLRDGARDLFDRTEQAATEVPRSWRHIPVHDLRMISGANSSSGRTTHFADSGTTVQHYSWGLTCWKIYPFAMSWVVVGIHRDALWYSHLLLRNGKKYEFCHCQKVIKLQIKIDRSELLRSTAVKVILWVLNNFYPTLIACRL